MPNVLGPVYMEVGDPPDVTSPTWAPPLHVNRPLVKSSLVGVGYDSLLRSKAGFFSAVLHKANDELCSVHNLNSL